MTPTFSDDSSPEPSEADVDEREVARLLEQYLEGEESVSDDGMREILQKAIRGTIVQLNSEDTELTVIVEQAPAERDEPVRECYAVRYIPSLEGAPTFDWAYLGSVD